MVRDSQVDFVGITERVSEGRRVVQSRSRNILVPRGGTGLNGPRGDLNRWYSSQIGGKLWDFGTSKSGLVTQSDDGWPGKFHKVQKGGKDNSTLYRRTYFQTSYLETCDKTNKVNLLRTIVSEVMHWNFVLIFDIFICLNMKFVTLVFFVMRFIWLLVVSKKFSGFLLKIFTLPCVFKHLFY